MTAGTKCEPRNDLQRDIEETKHANEGAKTHADISSARARARAPMGCAQTPPPRPPPRPAPADVGDRRVRVADVGVGRAVGDVCEVRARQRRLVRVAFENAPEHLGGRPRVGRHQLRRGGVARGARRAVVAPAGRHGRGVSECAWCGVVCGVRECVRGSGALRAPRACVRACVCVYGLSGLPGGAGVRRAARQSARSRVRGRYRLSLRLRHRPAHSATTHARAPATALQVDDPRGGQLC
jgi:hypothetical protein